MACPFPKTFPTWVYHPDGRSQIVADAIAFERLSDEWGNTPFVNPPHVVAAPIVYSESELRIPELNLKLDRVNALNTALNHEASTLRQSVIAKDTEIARLLERAAFLESALSEARAEVDALTAPAQMELVSVASEPTRGKKR